MTAGERRYGDRESHVIPVWNGIFDHYHKLGIAVWAFMWLIDRITSEQDGTGRVLGGKPVKIEEIVATMKGATYRTIRRQLDTLEREGYIKRLRTPYGFVIEVKNSQKWGIWKAKESGQKGQSDGERVAKKVTEIALFGRNKEDSAGTQQKRQEAAAPVLKDCWKKLGVALPIGHVRFQGEWEAFHGQHHDEPVVDVMEAFIQFKQERGQRDIPRKFYDVKHDLERMDKEVVEAQRQVQAKQVPVFQEEPWMQQVKK